MKSCFGLLQRHARQEQKRIFNPEEPPPHGDFPHLAVEPLQAMERSFGHQVATQIWLAVSITSIFAIAVMVIAAMSLVIAFPFDWAFRR